MPQFSFIIAAIVLNVLLLIGLILLLPRLLRRQDSRVAEEAARLREILLDVLNEQEAVTLRQAQIDSSLSSMQFQIGKLAEAEVPNLNISPEALAKAAGIAQLEQRLDSLRTELGTWFERGANERRVQQINESQSWTYLISLLTAMQDHLATLNAAARQQPQASPAAGHLLQELDKEMQNLRVLADEISGLQWKLRRSLLERETSLAALRAQVLGPPRFGPRAA